MATDYLFLKMLHIFGVVIFLGNIIVTGWWKALADRTREARIVAYAQQQVTWTDFIFTTGGVVIILITGLWMAHQFAMRLWEIKWLLWGLGLFIASGIIWVAILIPVQIKQARIAKQFAQGGDIPAEYWRLGRLWLIWGTLATVLPLLNLYWMVFKPN